MTENLLAGSFLGELKEIVDGCVIDYIKAKKNNKSAAIRVRRKMMRVKELYKEIRKELNG